MNGGLLYGTDQMPHCGTVFTIDESNYNSIVSQIRDHEFQKELQERLQTHLSLEKERAAKQSAEQLNEKDKEIASLKNLLEAAKREKDSSIRENEANNARKLAEQLAEKDRQLAAYVSKSEAKTNELNNELALLKEQLSHAEQAQKNAVSLAVSEKEKEP